MRNAYSDRRLGRRRRRRRQWAVTIIHISQFLRVSGSPDWINKTRKRPLPGRVLCARVYIMPGFSSFFFPFIFLRTSQHSNSGCRVCIIESCSTGRVHHVGLRIYEAATDASATAAIYLFIGRIWAYRRGWREGLYVCVDRWQKGGGGGGGDCYRKHSRARMPSDKGGRANPRLNAWLAERPVLLLLKDALLFIRQWDGTSLSKWDTSSAKR